MEIAGADPEWATGFEEECWWSRVALTTLNAWSEDGEPLRLLQRSPRMIPSPKPSPATGSTCPRLRQATLGFGSWTADP